MIDFQKYPWCSKNIAQKFLEGKNEIEATKFLDYVSSRQDPAYEKEALASYYLEQKSSVDFNHLNKACQNWKSSNAYKKTLQQVLENDETKFMMSSIVIIMAGTICIYFLRAILANQYLVNFSIDAIAGSIAIVFLFIHFRKKYMVLKRFGKFNDYLLMDIISFLMCVLLKFIIPPMFDLSVVILFVTYYIQKKKFNTVLRKCID